MYRKVMEPVGTQEALQHFIQPCHVCGCIGCTVHARVLVGQGRTIAGPKGNAVLVLPPKAVQTEIEVPLDAEDGENPDIVGQCLVECAQPGLSLGAIQRGQQQRHPVANRMHPCICAAAAIQVNQMSLEKSKHGLRDGWDSGSGV